MNHDDSNPNNGLKQAELVRLHALQVTDPSLPTVLRVAQAEAFAKFLFGPAAEPVQLKPPVAE